ncbi:hypothetical protein COV16_00415 [Candidatus Woesearchaeota archaeon CG10_big_fil_rev_8_21_14_0_10_34_8]|jgi:tRNA (guanine26-N2/guanine27-N2)-dimethyltransferase|nr:MAG: hypothetical protein COV16_00415 [Candidatus Woesearchaeota archaeon CG10_big_fil_rev_8_21_14_0_10_34_8]
MYKLVKESKAEIYIPKEDKISKSLPVFYNKDMKIGRDVVIHLINNLKPQHICDTMAGTGIRSIRIAKETSSTNILANDINPEAVKLIKKNAKHNNVELEIHNKDLRILLQEQEGFDYIDIDPFGSPTYFLDSASSLKEKGVLALTATDLGCLYGKYINTCKRKYSSTPLYCPFKNEIGLRILAQKVITTASKYDKALTPIFSHVTQHYARMYFQSSKSKTKTNELLKQIKYIEYDPKNLELNITDYPTHNVAGPIFTGNLWEKSLTEKFTLIPYLKEESEVNTIGYYNIPRICKKLKINCSKKINTILEEIKSQGYQASRTHLSLQGIKSNIPHKEFLKII